MKQEYFQLLLPDVLGHNGCDNESIFKQKDSGGLLQ